MKTSELIASTLVWDNHGCMPFRPHDQTFLPQLDRYKKAGVDVVFLNIGFGDQTIEEHIRNTANFRHFVKTNSDKYLLVDTVDDIDRARESGRLAIGFDIEGANAISDQLSLIELYYDLGVRWMLIAYNVNNRVGGGCQDNDTGLTAYGRAVLDEMARVGMVVCCTHTGERTVRDVFDYTKRPVIFSHSNPRAIHDHPRNITDDMMRGCAATGGVVGINGIGIFLGKNDISTDAFVRHVDHAVQLIGPQHVGLGLDYVFDAAEMNAYLAKMKHTYPPGLGYEEGIKMVPPEQLADIVERLSAMGYSDEDLRAILGGNLLRVAREVWKPSAVAQA